MGEIQVGAGIGILMVRDGKFLMGKRHDDAEKADSALSGEGTWCMPGGKLDRGDSLESGAMREVLEETGIKLNSVNIIGVTNDIGPKAHFVTVSMFSDDFEGEAKVMEPDEITEWKWFDFDDLPEKVFFPCIKILKNYKEKVFYKH